MKRIQINGNGDEVEVLLGQVKTAMKTLEEAGKAVSNLTIHGRNYQTLAHGSQAFQDDLDEKDLIKDHLAESGHILREWRYHLIEQKRVHGRTKNRRNT
jgi:DNA-binding PadR family transcriptional regulator